MSSVDVAAWKGRFATVLARLETLFVRPEPRRTVGAYLLGLLSAVERKNCWWLAEHAGHARPDAMQRLLSAAQWDADEARDWASPRIVEGSSCRLAGGRFVVDR